MNLAWIYAFNILVNSVLAFVTVALLVKFLLWAFRIKQPRIQALCLSLPLFKIGFDFFLYDFSRWALKFQINPFLCEPGTRTFSVGSIFPGSLIPYTYSSGIGFSIEGGKTFTVADMIALLIDPLWIKLIVVLAFSVSLVFCSVRLIQFFRAKKVIKKIIENALPRPKEVSFSLQSVLRKRGVYILISTEVDVPCAVSRSIIFPERLLEKLSQAEFEAIVVHELDHLRWKDSILRVIQRLLATFFWWIPTKRWQSRLELSQELACDAKIIQYGLAPIDLASAITKAARSVSRPYLPVMYFVEKGRLLERMKALVHPAKKRSWGFTLIQTLLIFGCLTMIFFGEFWIF